MKRITIIILILLTSINADVRNPDKTEVSKESLVVLGFYSNTTYGIDKAYTEKWITKKDIFKITHLKLIGKWKKVIIVKQSNKNLEKLKRMFQFWYFIDDKRKFLLTGISTKNKANFKVIKNLKMNKYMSELKEIKKDINISLR